MKITNPEYNLPIIEALTPFKLFENSANKPLLISGVDSITGERGELVVKLKK